MLLVFFIRPLEPVGNFAMMAFRVYKSHRFLYGSCSHHTCFNVELYSLPNRIRIYVYPDLLFLLDAVNSSKYAVGDPSEACLFVSSLNFDENSLLSSSEMNNRRNHLVFDLDYGRSFDNIRFPLQSFPGMVAGSGFKYSIYRTTYDVSLPVVSLHFASVINHFSNYFQGYVDKLLQNHWEHNKLPSAIVKRDQISSMFMMFRANDYSYSKISISFKMVLASSLFCLVDQTHPPSTLLFDVMQAGCIPIFLGSDFVLPFSEKLDWTARFALIISNMLESLVDVISTYSEDEIVQLQHHVNFFYSKYMSSLAAVITTALDIINSRV
ncbi:unnamed protein product, partial [Hydatigera taeniaeformis]|uniref:Exostosin domain-containing protein n=1 Tax=Hydatigena taeniaeformis TaxID=6205 RepID=A0A0R3WVY0_HYDTA